MDIRTFEAFTMKDAVKSVKQALGSDAVILSTKEKPAPGGKGMIYELTAASAASQRASASATSYPSAFGINNTHSPTGALGNPSAGLESQLEGLSVRLTAIQDSAPNRRQVQSLETGLQELKLLVLEALRQKDGSIIQDLPPAVVPIDRQLRVMGLDETYIAELLKHLRALPPAFDGDRTSSEDRSADAYRDEAIRFMMKRIKIAPRWSIVPGSTTVQVFIGTSGVGKTSTVAKLAAHYHSKEKNKIAVVSFDNHRLAAAEQMRIFCKIIGVPFTTISSAAELPQTIEAHRDAELILVDTAGISPKDQVAIEQLRALRHNGLAIDFNLCLSITEKETQLTQAIRAFASVGIASLIFTKLDESWSFGEIYNLAKKWSLPLGFFSVGPEIPEGLERATRERVIERIFGL